MNDVIQLQALVDKKKMVVTEATIREALHLDDAEGVECLPNEEIFAELARMGYEKPSTKLTFYKAFFSSQWKFLIHTILQCMSAKRTSWNEFRDAEVHGKEENAGDTAEGDVSAAHREVPTADEEPSIPSPTPHTPPPQPSHDIPFTSQRVKTSDETVMDDVSNQGRMIAEVDADTDVVLEDDKEVADEAKEVAEDSKVDDSADIQGGTEESQAKIYKIDLDHANKVLSMDEDETEPAEVQEVVDVVTTAKLITEVVTAASETITTASANITAAEAQVPTVTLTAAPTRVVVAPSKRRKGVVIRDPEEESTTSIIISAETKSKDKGKGILVEELKPLKKKQQIEQDEQYDRELQAELNKNIDWDKAIDHVKRNAKEDSAMKIYQVLKKKPRTEAQARKNMMVYLKNVAGFKMDYFKGMPYDDIFKRGTKSDKNTVDASLIVTEYSRTKSDKKDASSSSGNYIAHAVDADIRPVNDQVPFAE
nr:hypothetical protein [Tanacetum cinerariifolium]